MMKKQFTTAILIYFLSAACIAEQQQYRDYAQVIEVVPVTHFQHGGYQPCQILKLPAIAQSIADDIRQQQKTWQQNRDCEAYLARHYESFIAGYQVTYRYQGYTGTKFVTDKPGNYLPISVGLTPVGK